MCIQRQKAIDLKLDFYAEFVNLKTNENEEDGIENGIQKYSPVIHCDEQRIMQVLLGLQSNALKFTQQGKVIVRVEIIEKEDKENPTAKKRYLQISVVDTGIGIAKEDHHKLFKLFGFVKDSKQMNTKGIGLGLMISELIVKQFNGWIEFQSEKNEGSTFTFNFKLEDEEENFNLAQRDNKTN